MMNYLFDHDRQHSDRDGTPNRISSATLVILYTEDAIQDDRLVETLKQQTSPGITSSLTTR